MLYGTPRRPSFDNFRPFTTTERQMFEGFVQATIDTGEAQIHVLHGGSGPPVLLLHGIPETHIMWHKVAPRLARDFSVVAADLRGYGDSSKPASTPDHAPYSKRAMARDQVEAMRQLGFETFSVVGHDRGARCAYRMALDHPQRIAKLAVLDIVPTGDVFRRVNMSFAIDFWVWFFLAQPADLPERMIGANPQVILDSMLDGWSAIPNAFPPEVRAEYSRTFSNPAALHAICEEYRASATLDHQYDEADRGRRRIVCPVAALWGGKSALTKWFDVPAVWSDWADDVRGGAIDCGHFLPEEAPDETYEALREFLAS
jgi:haloacetate dehalogenase